MPRTLARKFAAITATILYRLGLLVAAVGAGLTVLGLLPTEDPHGGALVVFTGVAVLLGGVIMVAAGRVIRTLTRRLAGHEPQ